MCKYDCNDGELVDKFYENDPLTEDVIFGDKLRNGMRVLLEDSTFKPDLSQTNPSGYDLERRREISRWCEVSEVRFSEKVVSFIGIYDDGTKKKRAYAVDWAWIVKKVDVVTPETRILGILVEVGV
jgi:hypothetical protein